MTGVSNIVSVMIQQHRKLQGDLGSAAELAAKKGSGQEIEKLLKNFLADLDEHLKLENGVFYVQLLEKMKAKGQDTAKTEQFIAEMNIIGKAVMEFLDKYSKPASIDEDEKKFSEELKNIITVLNLRIESEESGVYAYWALF